jgi:uncharacterized repeat protein (TIGR01451 family)
MILDVLVISSSLLIRDQASAVSGTGVGIRIDGEPQAHIGDTIEYAITVYSLGDYWIRNVTIIDVFPNGASSIWNPPDLAPRGQLGDSFSVSGILYTILSKDVPGGTPSYVTDHAEISGYSDVQGLMAPVQAETNYLTFVIGVPVGGYAISIKTRDASPPTAIQSILLLTMSIAFLAYGAWRQEAYPSKETALRVHTRFLRR